MFGNWKPDFLSAVPYFDKAAALFKAAGAPDQARDMYLKSADCNVRTYAWCLVVTVYNTRVPGVRSAWARPTTRVSDTYHNIIYQLQERTATFAAAAMAYKNAAMVAKDSGDEEEAAGSVSYVSYLYMYIHICVCMCKKWGGGSVRAVWFFHVDIHTHAHIPDLDPPTQKTNKQTASPHARLTCGSWAGTQAGPRTRSSRRQPRGRTRT